MGKFEQLDFAKRVTIQTYLDEGKSASFIARNLNVNKSTITREIQRNRAVNKSAKCKVDCVCIDCMSYGNCKVKELCQNKCKQNCCGCSFAKECSHKVVYDCKNKLRFPYVCNSCPKKENCPKEQIEYDGIVANNISTTLKSSSRKGLNMTEEEFEELDSKVKEAVENGQSIYHLVETKQVNRCVKSIYDYINRQILTTKNMDLPRKVTLKKRKINKKYQYDENCEIDRSGRMYQDFLKYKLSNKIGFYVQMDFLGSKNESSQQIFTLTFLPCQFIWLAVFDKHSTADDVIKLFNSLEQKLGYDCFANVFSTILTDRDVLFNKFENIEASSVKDKEKRTHIFYCDSASSYQKANVENSNAQIRKIFPKEDVVEGLDEVAIAQINSHLNSRSLASLDGMCAFDAFKLAFGEEILNALNVKKIDTNNVKIINYRAYRK